MLKDYLTRIMNARADAAAMIASENFVFHNVGKADEDLTEAQRWEKLAFSLYTRLGVASAIAEEALVALSEGPVAEAEWVKRHS